MGKRSALGKTLSEIEPLVVTLGFLLSYVDLGYL